MRKKIKDFTLEELRNYCKSCDWCEECPLHRVADCGFCYVNISDEEMNMEVYIGEN